MDANVVSRLLAFRPFKRFYLCIGRDEVFIERPEHAKLLGDTETLFVSEDGTADFYDLRLVERIRVDDDFGFDELGRMWK
jgi:hypothetical protein